MSPKPEKDDPTVEPPGSGDGGAPESAPAGDLAAERGQLAAELAERTGQHLRALADLDNYRKRAARERGEASVAGKCELAAAILPALDALDLAIRHAAEARSADGLLEGVKAARDALERALTAQGAERIPASGGYDPDLHSVQAAVERADLPEGTIIEELRPGYRFGKLVARHGEVVVSRRPAAPAEPKKPEPPEAEASEEDQAR